MSHVSVHHLLGPGVPDLAALGARSAEDLLAPPGASEAVPGLEEGHRAEVVNSGQGATLLRVPLPGTPTEDGAPLSGRPRGAGTGWVYLRRYERAGLGESMRARLGRPRSQSLAEREWNLICHVRRYGVGTPEPLAVGHRGDGAFSDTSFLVTRALDGFLPLDAWLERTRENDGLRRRGAVAVGQTLARLFDSTTHLPRLSPRHVHLSFEEEDACALQKIARVQEEHGVLHPQPPGGSGGEDSTSGSKRGPRLRLRRLPEVCLTGFREGSLMRRVDLDTRLEVLDRLFRGLAEEAEARDVAVLPRLGALAARYALDRDYPRLDRSARGRLLEHLRRSAGR